MGVGYKWCNNIELPISHSTVPHLPSKKEWNIHRLKAKLGVILALVDRIGDFDKYTA